MKRVLCSVALAMTLGSFTAAEAMAQGAAGNGNTGGSDVVGHVGNGGGAATSTADTALSSTTSHGCAGQAASQRTATAGTRAAGPDCR